MRDKDLYAQILGIKSPWQVTRVDLSVPEGAVTVQVEREEGSMSCCPTCSKESPGYDSRPRRWRHLDTCQYKTILVADVPRVKCEEHGVVTVSVPWAEPGSGFTAMFEALVIDWLTHVGCMAHARRKFSEAVKAQGKKKKKGKAHQGLVLIQKLYRVEKQARRLTSDERYVLRQQQARPIPDELRRWLDDSLPQVPPTSAAGKAMHYLRREWTKLIHYLDDGRLEIDNNGAENAIRPFVVGRKNWLFSASVKGVTSSANLYSLIETAKANGLEPYAYLRYLFTALPKAETVEVIETLLPGNVDPDQIRNC